MPAVVLRHRRPELSEKMDALDCPQDRLFRTYDQFRILNPVVSGWHGLYTHILRPAAQSCLDSGTSRPKSGSLGRPTQASTDSIGQPPQPSINSAGQPPQPSINSAGQPPQPSIDSAGQPPQPLIDAGEPARPLSILDVGCGGGDILDRLARWFERDHLPLDALGIDPDPRAMAYVDQRSFPASVRFEPVSTSDLLEENRRFDFVISNHVLHHLDGEELSRFLADTRALARQCVLHNDLRRDDLAWLLFAPTRLLFHGSFTTVDGLTSIRRSWRADELRRELPPGWKVQPFGLFRNLVSFDAGGPP